MFGCIITYMQTQVPVRTGIEFPGHLTHLLTEHKAIVQKA